MCALRRIVVLLALAAMIGGLAGQTAARDMGMAAATVAAAQGMAAAGGCGGCDGDMPAAAACFLHCGIAAVVLPTAGAAERRFAAMPRPRPAPMRVGRSTIPDPYPPRPFVSGRGAAAPV